jgi:hypothetical protein
MAIFAALVGVTGIAVTIIVVIVHTNKLERLSKFTHTALRAIKASGGCDCATQCPTTTN